MRIEIDETIAWRESRHRRSFGAAILVSGLLHALLFLVVPAPRLLTGPAETAAPHIGFEGPEIVLPELNPQEYRVDEQEQVATARLQAGALISQPVEILPESEAPEELPRRLASGLQGRSPDTNPVVELGEDWSLRSTSAPTSRSSDFVILKLVRPEYPRLSVSRGVEGVVRVQAAIDAEGNVGEVELLGSEVDRMCEEETIRAMKLWKFRPYERDGRAIPFRVIVPFRFRLED
ncbi:MAG: energy transducer TonB [Candidatus Eisenbacteria bacterium]|nr:TonB family protein [Candidatus Eisenbacteria bacterium]